MVRLMTTKIPEAFSEQPALTKVYRDMFVNGFDAVFRDHGEACPAVAPVGTGDVEKW